MPRGGARTKSGPAPDPNALRRSRKDDQDWVTLPAEGRDGDLPEWPMLANPEQLLAEREHKLWANLWTKPQAVQWEIASLEYEVAMYVRRAVEAELPGAAAGLGTLVLRMADNLGITPQGMNANRWKLGVVAEDPEDDDEDDDNVVDARDLFAAGG